MIDLSIQIINYNTKKYLVQCLRDLYVDLQEVDFSYDILVLDNDSADDLGDLNVEFSSVRFLQSPSNLGFAAGHNYLAKKSSSRYILFLNPDIRFMEKNTVTRMMNKIEGSQSVKVIGPKLLRENGKPQWYDHGRSEGFLAKSIMRSGNSLWRPANKDTICAWVSGAFFLIERAVFEDVGAFDENYFLYKEEEDLCLQIRRAEHEVLYYPQVQVMHYGSVVGSKPIYMEQSLQYYLKKNLSETSLFPFYKIVNKIGYRVYKYALRDIY